MNIIEPKIILILEDESTLRKNEFRTIESIGKLDFVEFIFVDNKQSVIKAFEGKNFQYIKIFRNDKNALKEKIEMHQAVNTILFGIFDFAVYEKEAKLKSDGTYESAYERKGDSYLGLEAAKDLTEKNNNLKCKLYALTGQWKQLQNKEIHTKKLEMILKDKKITDFFVKGYLKELKDIKDLLKQVIQKALD